MTPTQKPIWKMHPWIQLASIRQKGKILYVFWVAAQTFPQFYYPCMKNVTTNLFFDYHSWGKMTLVWLLFQKIWLYSDLFCIVFGWFFLHNEFLFSQNWAFDWNVLNQKHYSEMSFVILFYWLRWIGKVYLLAQSLQSWIKCLLRSIR